MKQQQEQQKPRNTRHNVDTEIHIVHDTTPSTNTKKRDSDTVVYDTRRGGSLQENTYLYVTFCLHYRAGRRGSERTNTVGGRLMLLITSKVVISANVRGYSTRQEKRLHHHMAKMT